MDTDDNSSGTITGSDLGQRYRHAGDLTGEAPTRPVSVLWTTSLHFHRLPGGYIYFTVQRANIWCSKKYVCIFFINVDNIL